MKKKVYVIILIITIMIVGLFHIFAGKNNWTSIVSLKYEDIKEIKLEGRTDAGRIDKTATEKETKNIIKALNSIKSFEKEIEDHSWPAPMSQIEIFTKDNEDIQIREFDEDEILIGYRYVAKQPEIKKILEDLRK